MNNNNNKNLKSRREYDPSEYADEQYKKFKDFAFKSAYKEEKSKSVVRQLSLVENLLVHGQPKPIPSIPPRTFGDIKLLTSIEQPAGQELAVVFDGDIRAPVTISKHGVGETGLNLDGTSLMNFEDTSGENNAFETGQIRKHHKSYCRILNGRSPGLEFDYHTANNGIIPSTHDKLAGYYYLDVPGNSTSWTSSIKMKGDKLSGSATLSFILQTKSGAVWSDLKTVTFNSASDHPYQFTLAPGSAVGVDAWRVVLEGANIGDDEYYIDNIAMSLAISDATKNHELEFLTFDPEDLAQLESQSGNQVDRLVVSGGNITLSSEMNILEKAYVTIGENPETEAANHLNETKVFKLPGSSRYDVRDGGYMILKPQSVDYITNQAEINNDRLKTSGKDYIAFQDSCFYSPILPETVVWLVQIKMRVHTTVVNSIIPAVSVPIIDEEFIMLQTFASLASFHTCNNISIATVDGWVQDLTKLANSSMDLIGGVAALARKFKGEAAMTV